MSIFKPIKEGKAEGRVKEIYKEMIASRAQAKS